MKFVIFTLTSTIFLLLVFFLSATPCLSAPSLYLYDTFDVDTADWVVVNYPFHSHVPNPNTMSVTFDSFVGNPPGSLRITDHYPETGVAAPTRYLGDLGAYYGGSIMYDIYIRYSDSIDYPAVVLNAGTMSVYYDTPAPVLNSWESRTIPLTEQGWRESDTGNVVSEMTFRNVLSNLQGLYIYTEWHTGVDDTNFDNVNLVNTVMASITSTQSSGTLPFTTQMTATLSNICTGQLRRMAAMIHIELGSGDYIAGWRAGYTNIAQGGNYVSTWNQDLPALGTLVGDNTFQLVAEDVTPAPYNQPPYPPAGDTYIASSTVTGIAP